MGRVGYSDLGNIKTAKQKKQEAQEVIINSDIVAIDNAIESGNEEQLKSVHILIEGKYSSCIPNIGQSMYGYFDKLGFNYELIDQESLKHNLWLMKAKLQGYLCDFRSKSVSSASQNNINVSVPITNEINISITFEQAKQKIEDMPGLTDAETEEIKSKIGDLENISKESISKKKKWEKVKPILLFALDKGADVAITIMGLILQ
ncbi:MAG: hypothetical protein KH355_09115, partial [Clostridiales bacterium]|nr:hypothetical protein [Clostridiales bacterium]